MSEDQRVQGAVGADDRLEIEDDFEEEDVWAPDAGQAGEPTVAQTPDPYVEPAPAVAPAPGGPNTARVAASLAAIIVFTILVISVAASVNASRRADALARRVRALETTSPSSTGTDGSLEPRLAALESRLSAVPTGSVDAATIAAINAQIEALDARIKALPSGTTDTSTLTSAINKLQRDVQRLLVCVGAHEDRLNGRDAQFACNL